jgi:hypothetical protein
METGSQIYFAPVICTSPSDLIPFNPLNVIVGLVAAAYEAGPATLE